MSHKTKNITAKLDPCQTDVINLINSQTGATLWITDENLSNSEPLAVRSNTQLTAITNRFDVQQTLLMNDIECIFNDFDLSPFNDKKFDQIVYRISKEKAVIHHIVNQAHNLLADDGTLYLIGLKNDGLKRFTTNAQIYFKNSNTKKNGISYTSILSEPLKKTESQLDDDDYTILRQIAALPACTLAQDEKATEIAIFSKPGTFGWDKVDQGSYYLIEQLPDVLHSYYQENNNYPQTLLDLGCGYGYLTLMTASLPLNKRLATDNNAAALNAIAHNAKVNHMNVQVVPANCAETINERFDLILCNPPFHQGFQTDESLTERFLIQTKKHLSHNGLAIFVVNGFLALEKKAAAHFRHVTEIANNKKFKVILLRQ